MEARITSCLVLALSYFSFATSGLIAADYTTRNFSVQAPSRQFAKQVGDLAEEYRKELAIKWTGKELPDWPERCPIRVQIRQHAGGETSFVFMPDHTGRSAPSQWRMLIFGPPERILDSVLPHEVTHTIFATHFGRPLPRWADEGACTTVEHKVERERNHRMLIEFLKTKRGIPFNHMFSMKQYPRDILPLYAQGHSLARYLIMQKGERHFVNYIGEGMDREVAGRIPESWNQTTKKFYGYKDLSDLQVKWLKWVSDGCPEIEPTSPGKNADVAQISAPIEQPVANSPTWQPKADVGDLLKSRPPTTRVASVDSWYIEQMKNGGSQKGYREQSHVQGSEFRPGSIGESVSIDQLMNPAGNSNLDDKGTQTIWR